MRLVVEDDFVAGHRLKGHDKCYVPHGHNYHVKVTIKGEKKDNGMIVDTGRIRGIIKTWDHAWLGEGKIKVGGRSFLPALNERPTAENIAEKLCSRILSCCDNNIDCVDVEVWETVDAKASTRGYVDA